MNTLRAVLAVFAMLAAVLLLASGAHREAALLLVGVLAHAALFAFQWRSRRGHAH